MGRKGMKLVLALRGTCWVPTRFRAWALRGSLKLCHFVLCRKGWGVCIWGGGAGSQPCCVEGEGLVHPSYAAQGRPMGGGRGFWSLINPSGMYVVLAIPIPRQRSGVQARACPGCGCGPWRGPHQAGLG